MNEVVKDLWREVNDSVRAQMKDHLYRTLGAAFFAGFAIGRSRGKGLRSLLWSIAGRRVASKLFEIALQSATKRLLAD